MPSKSAKQQKFFGMVHAYQTGKLPADKASSSVKKVASTISQRAARDYAKSGRASLAEIRDIIKKCEDK